jgi:hypothetical protein
MPTDYGGIVLTAIEIFLTVVTTRRTLCPRPPFFFLGTGVVHPLGNLTYGDVVLCRHGLSVGNGGKALGLVHESFKVHNGSCRQGRHVSPLWTTRTDALSFRHLSRTSLLCTPVFSCLFVQLLLLQVQLLLLQQVQLLLLLQLDLLR